MFIQILKTVFHANITTNGITNGSKLSIVKRSSTRAIIMRDNNIPMLYTQRYDEYRPWYKANADIIHMISIVMSARLMMN